VRGPSAAAVAQAAEGGGEWHGGRARVRGLVVWGRCGREKHERGEGQCPLLLVDREGE